MTYRDEITASRAALAALRAEIEAEFERRRASIQTRLEDACLGLFEETGKYAEVSRAYGTKDFRTVKTLVESAQQRREQFEPFLPDDTPTVSAEYDPETGHIVLTTLDGERAEFTWTGANPVWKNRATGSAELAARVLNDLDSPEREAVRNAL